MTDWDDLVEPARSALETLISKGDDMADRIEELEAKLAEVEASSQGWIDAAVEQQVRRKRAEARLVEVEAERDMARIQTGEKE